MYLDGVGGQYSARPVQPISEDIHEIYRVLARRPKSRRVENAGGDALVILGRALWVMDPRPANRIL